MTKNRKQLYAILAVMAVLFTVIAFAAPFRINGVFIISYLCGLIAFALQIPFFKAAFDDKESLKSKVLGFPVFRVGYIYLGIQTALSLLLMILSTAIPSFPVWVAIILCAIVLCGGLICGMTADIARDEVEKAEVSSSASTAFMTEMRARAAMLVNKTSDEKVKAELMKLAENFRYSDPVSNERTESADKLLEASLSELENAVINNADDILVFCRNTQNALDDRNEYAKISKRV